MHLSVFSSATKKNFASWNVVRVMAFGCMAGYTQCFFSLFGSVCILHAPSQPKKKYKQSNAKSLWRNMHPKRNRTEGILWRRSWPRRLPDSFGVIFKNTENATKRIRAKMRDLLIIDLCMTKRKEQKQDNTRTQNKPTDQQTKAKGNAKP